MREEAIERLCCPLCGGKLERREHSLLCIKGHCYDIARQGHVNFAPGQREMFYKKELFEHRASVFEAGVFEPVVQALTQAIDTYVRAPHPVVLDAGCGEGYYIKSVCPGREMVRIGFDLCKEAVRLAARGEKTASFFTADLARIPMQDASCDAVLDVFTPANYGEFGRVLREDGVLFKLAPRGRYLAQLRSAAGKALRRREYDGNQVERYVHERMEVLEQREITYTLAAGPELMGHLARMTPMLAGVDVDAIDLSGIREITVDEVLYIGRIRR